MRTKRGLKGANVGVLWSNWRTPIKITALGLQTTTLQFVGKDYRTRAARALFALSIPKRYGSVHNQLTLAKGSG